MQDRIVGPQSDRAMQDKKRSSGNAIFDAIRAERQSSRQKDRKILSDTLVKSPLWKENTLDEIETEQSQLTITDLEAEIARLTAEFDVEIKARNAEMAEIQAAYDQFEQQSDRILNELDQENERLRIECRSHNRRSIL